MKNMKLYWIDVTHLEPEASSSYKRGLPESIISMLAPKWWSSEQGYKVHQGTDYDFVYSGMSQEKAVQLIDQFLRPPTPPPLLRNVIDLGGGITHELSEMDSMFTAYMKKEGKLASQLFAILNEEENVDLTISKSVRDAIERMKSHKTTDHRTTAIGAIKTVTWELVSAIGYQYQHKFASMLKKDGRVLMIVAAFYDNEELQQMYITKPASTWIHDVEHPHEAVRNLALKLHSITTYALKQNFFPSIKEVLIPEPFPRMRQILEDAARTDQLQLRNKNRMVVIVITEGYLNMWRSLIHCETCNEEYAYFRVKHTQTFVCCGVCFTNKTIY